MAEPEEPIAPVARYVAWLLAALIGMVLVPLLKGLLHT